MANPSIPEFALETSGEQTVLRVSGDWTVRTVRAVDDGLRDLEAHEGALVLDAAALGKLDTRPPAGPVVVTVMDRTRVGDYQKLVSTLRNADIAAELYLGTSQNLGKQLKYADKRNAPAVVIQGGDERAAGEVQIKDLVLGAKIAETATHEEWKEQPAQFEIKRGDLVDKIREMLRSLIDIP